MAVEVGNGNHALAFKIGLSNECYLKENKKARVEWLKTRFAAIIAKANGGYMNAEKTQKERESNGGNCRKRKSIEREDCYSDNGTGIRQKKKEKVGESIQARLLRMKREKQRLALERLERTVDVDDNLRAMRELESLIPNPSRSPLHRLGLHLKKEFYWVDDDEDAVLNGELEEGEFRQ